jgi:hypothetical protein
MESPELRRVIAYVDGFNLYYGLKDSGWRWVGRCWLITSFRRLSKNLTGSYWKSPVNGRIPLSDKTLDSGPPRRVRDMRRNDTIHTFDGSATAKTPGINPGAFMLSRE